MLRKTKSGIPSNIIKDLINKLFREPVYFIAKYFYPRFYRIDNILTNQEEDILQRFNLNEDQLISNIGYANGNSGTITKPYMLPLSYDHVEFESNHILKTF